jgi:5-formyltetrahydrofolate cyclo-ligase
VTLLAIPDKPALRARARAARDALTDRAAREAAIGAQLLGLPEIRAARCVAAYWPMGSEVDPRAVMAALLQRSTVIALPRVVSRAAPLDFLAWSPDLPLEAGPLGTVQPPATAAALAPEVLIVPMLGFDRRLFRLGYGGGFYDRTLARLRAPGPVRAIGVAFACQELEALPDEPFDQPMDRIVTEDAVLAA